MWDFTVKYQHTNSAPWVALTSARHMDHTEALEVVVQHCSSENIQEFFMDSAVIFPFCWKRNFWMGLEGCLQVAWPSGCACKEQLPAAHSHP